MVRDDVRVRLVGLRNAHRRGTEYMAQSQNDKTAFEQAHLAFNVFLFTELCAKLLAMQMEYFFGKDWRWNLVDLIVVLTSVVDLFLSFGFDMARAGRAHRAFASSA